MCNFLKLQLGKSIEKWHIMANKAHDHAGNMAQ